MAEDVRKSELFEVFSGVDEREQKLARKLINEVVFLEEQMDELRKLPFISIHPTNKANQKSTAAAKQYKECSQSYMNAIRILLSLLRKEDNAEQNELLSRLSEYL